MTLLMAEFCSDVECYVVYVASPLGTPKAATKVRSDNWLQMKVKGKTQKSDLHWYQNILKFNFVAGNGNIAVYTLHILSLKISLNFLFLFFKKWGYMEFF